MNIFFITLIIFVLLYVFLTWFARSSAKKISKLIRILIIISSIFWLLINIRNNTHKEFFSVAKKNITFQILFFLILLQVILGAFVSGLDAGRIYQTWPLMGHSYIPNDLILKNLNNIFDFTN